ncbi:MAG TPA: alpha/beta fold hydrolase [Rhizomicrobium sp.]|nr:alpha/beta fold hydrolase [Rhizomicrobium sp.]
MANDILAVYPGRDSALGLMSLFRNGLSLARTFAQPPAPLVEDLPRGDGRPVLVVPAFLAGDWATLALRRFLSQLGYRIETAKVTLNFGPTNRLIERLDGALLRAAHEAPIDIIGQSLGGVLARDLARRHPDRVRRVITLCSPIRVPITTPLAPAAQMLSAFYDPDWLARRHAIAGPIGVPVTALYSEDDGVVDWRECLQGDWPDCRNVRVSGAHATIGSSPSALAAIAHALSS